MVWFPPAKDHRCATYCGAEKPFRGKVGVRLNTNTNTNINKNTNTNTNTKDRRCGTYCAAEKPFTGKVGVREIKYKFVPEDGVVFVDVLELILHC